MICFHEINMGVFDSHEAKNWLKQWLAVFTTWTAILPSVKIEAQQLHTYLLRLAANQSPCSLNHGKVTNKSQIGCRFHEIFRDEILLQHKQQPSWRNAPTDTWHNDEFAIAKLFMQPSGYDDKTSFEQVDFNGIAAFIFNCGRFSATTEALSDQTVKYCEIKSSERTTVE
ncbi:hypothetical protein MAR_036257 [Mya arenaria]|uniref:Uncharacterized protein n=1 Tax=Mya arenaria TaxID=6604 RepID=A0ABY7ER27_MYAAR|nr:hypothetical protein MAR_036257 [Mya arenaria]